MAANTSPVFTLTPVAKTGSLTGANTARDGTGSNLVTVLSAGASGTRIDRIKARGTGQTAAAQITLFINDGSSKYLFEELAIGAVTAGTTTAGASVELVRTDGLPLLTLPTGYALVAGLTVAPVSGSVLVVAYGGDY